MEMEHEHPDKDNSIEIVNAEFTDAGALFDRVKLQELKLIQQVRCGKNDTKHLAFIH